MKIQMINRKMFTLFLGNFAILFVGMGLFPVLPLYAAEFGATASMTGLYMGIVYAAITIGTLSTGWLAGRFNRRVLFILGGALGVPALALLGQATAFWQVVLLTSVVWFSGGVGLTLISLFTGLLSNGSNRGRSFSLMFLGSPLGALIGGTAVSRLLAWQGYPLMFAALSLVWAALPVIGLLGLKDQEISGAVQKAKTLRQGAQLGLTFILLLVVTLLAALSVSAIRIITSLGMQALKFSPQAVASTATVSGLITIPLTFLIGALSDRLDRRHMLMAGYVLAVGSALVLSAAVHLWHFWLSATFVLVTMGITNTASNALATEVLSPAALSRGLSWLSTMNWIASILSFIGSGLLMDHFGPQSIHLIAAVLPVGSFILLGVLPQAGTSIKAVGKHSSGQAASVGQTC